MGIVLYKSLEVHLHIHPPENAEDPFGHFHEGREKAHLKGESEGFLYVSAG
jgi:hypothetical protein